jgi:hypothetical protein
MRKLIVSAVAALAVAAGITGAASRAGSSCRTVDKSPHWEAVFGHFSSEAAAHELRTKLLKPGFKGLEIEDDGCGDFELKVSGLDQPAARNAFVKEAVGAHFEVTFEAPGPEPHTQGTLEAVFGNFKTIGEASDAQLKAASVGFRVSDIEYDGPRDWEVVVYGIPISKAAEFAKEARGPGLKISYEVH